MGIILDTQDHVREIEIRTRSYSIWEEEGRPEGRDLELWLRAKAELEAELASNRPATKVRKTVRGVRKPSKAPRKPSRKRAKP